MNSDIDYGINDSTATDIKKVIGVILLVVTLLAGHSHYSGTLTRIEAVTREVCGDLDAALPEPAPQVTVSTDDE